MPDAELPSVAPSADVGLVAAPTLADPLGAAVRLMSTSPLHSRWTISDVVRLILPPIEKDQCLFALADGRPVAFMSWGLFSPPVAQAFANRSRPLRAGDWQSGDALWIVDFIGPYGSVPGIVHALKDHLKARYPSCPGASAIRYKDLGAVRRISRWTR